MNTAVTPPPSPAVVLIDTNVASFLHPRRRDRPEYALYLPEVLGKVVAVSFQTVAELLAWAKENNWGVAARANLEVYLHQFLVIPYDFELARIWARLRAHSQSIGQRLGIGDAWIAATAVHRGLPLITHDPDFRYVAYPGLTVICHA